MSRVWPVLEFQDGPGRTGNRGVTPSFRSHDARGCEPPHPTNSQPSRLGRAVSLPRPGSLDAHGLSQGQARHPRAGLPARLQRATIRNVARPSAGLSVRRGHGETLQSSAVVVASICSESSARRGVPSPVTMIECDPQNKQGHRRHEAAVRDQVSRVSAFRPRDAPTKYRPNEVRHWHQTGKSFRRLVSALSRCRPAETGRLGRAQCT